MQAEALISTAMNYNYNPVNSQIVTPHIPPVICHSSLSQKKTLPLKYGYHKPENRPSTSLNLNLSDNESSTSGVSVFSSSSTTTYSSSLPDIDEDKYVITLTDSASPSSSRKKHYSSKRKDSLAHLHRPPSSGSNISLDDYSYQVSSSSERKLIPDHKLWNTSMMDNNVIVSQFGDTTYPLLMWDPRVKVDFRLSSSIGLITGMVTGIDPEKSTVTMKVTNTTGKRIGIAIRAHRQTTVFKPYMIFPSSGLYTIGTGENERVWEDNVEFYPKDAGKIESFVIDLFVCTLDGYPSWNVQRKYAIMKGHKSLSAPLKRVTKRRPSHFHMPGTIEQKAENLKLIISHGLQCVVKRKLDEAEVILSQALHLPDFQRVLLKAFLYICLAVVANKRKRLGHSKTLTPMLMATNAALKLVEIVESTPGSLNMPKMVMLVKQLKKELNVTRIMKEEYKRVEKQTSLGKLEEKEESCLVEADGGKITYKSTELSIPPGAVSESTQITLSTPDCQQLRTLLKSQGWDKVVNLSAAMHIQCAPFKERFEKPVEITTTLSEGISIGSCSLVRLLQSKYQHHWQDITDDVKSNLTVMENKLTISTDQTGWLTVATVKYDISLIAQLAMRSLSAEPTTLQLDTYGLVDTENSRVQVAIFITPCSSPDDAAKNKNNQKPQNHQRIAFPHTIQAYPGEKLQLVLQGAFEPEPQMGENSLYFEFEVQQNFQRILEKWLRITPEKSVDHSRALNGKLIVNSCRNAMQQWEPIAEINLSTKDNYSTASLSSDSDL